MSLVFQLGPIKHSQTNVSIRIAEVQRWEGKIRLLLLKEQKPRKSIRLEKLPMFLCKVC